MRFIRKRPEWLETVLIVGTILATVDVVARWGLGAFDSAAWSTTIVSTLLNLCLVGLAVGGVSAAIYQRKKRRDSDQFIVDLADRLPGVQISADAAL